MERSEWGSGWILEWEEGGGIWDGKRGVGIWMGIGMGVGMGVGMEIGTGIGMGAGVGTGMGWVCVSLLLKLLGKNPTTVKHEHIKNSLPIRPTTKPDETQETISVLRTTTKNKQKHFLAIVSPLLLLLLSSRTSTPL